MKKKSLNVCNHSLLVLFPLALITGILIECLQGAPLWGVGCVLITWLHIVSAMLMAVFVVWHLFLNWRSVSEWWMRLKKHRSKVLKCTAITMAMTIVMGFVAFPQWLLHGHTGIGGFHGKFGYLAAIFSILHIAAHWSWYTKKRKIGQ